MYRLIESNIAIKERYRLSEVLGQGGFGVTYRAEDLQTHRWVAVKAVVLRDIKDWKVLDLLERETQILQSLDHSAIPKYLDSFELDTDDTRTFYLVQELAPGKTLAQWIAEGWQPSQAEVLNIAQQILEISVYLQSFTPPIIHRDIKPQNLLRDPDSKIHLVDFGSVQDTYRHTVTGGSTVVGTFGYMAPEQFRGHAEPATDLYGLGATLIFLLTGKDPAELPQKKLCIDFQAALPPGQKLDSFLSRWLNYLIAPNSKKRFAIAQAALAALAGEKPLPDTSEASDRLHLQQDETSFLLEIGPLGLRLRRFRILTIASCATTIVMLLWFILILAFPYSESYLRQELAIATAGIAIASTISLRCIMSGYLSSWIELTPESFFVGAGPWTKRYSYFLGTKREAFPIGSGPYSLLQQITFVRSRWWSLAWRSIGSGQARRFEMWIDSGDGQLRMMAHGLLESETEFIREQIRNLLTNSTPVPSRVVNQIMQDQFCFTESESAKQSSIELT